MFFRPDSSRTMTPITGVISIHNRSDTNKHEIPRTMTPITGVISVQNTSEPHRPDSRGNCTPLGIISVQNNPPISRSETPLAGSINFYNQQPLNGSINAYNQIYLSSMHDNYMANLSPGLNSRSSIVNQLTSWRNKRKTWDQKLSE